MKRCMALILAMMMWIGFAQAESQADDGLLPAPEEAVSVADAGVDLPGGSIHYPQVQGMADEALQETVNQAILAAGQVEERLNRAALLGSSAVKLDVTYRLDAGALAGGVISCAFSSLGALTDSRSTHGYDVVNLNLQSGEAITLADLFTEESAARAAIEDYLWERVAPELSAHLQNSELTPLPEAFTLDAAGITFYYPITQLSTLSDRAGTVQIAWCELRSWLRLGEGTVLRRIGAEAMITLGGRERIEQAVAAGEIPGLPVKLGGSMQEATDTYRMLVDPDLYEDGRLFQLEDGAFRTVYLMTDRLTEGWAESAIQGIRLDRGNLWGLCVGETTRDAWRQALGEPDATVTLDAEKADGQRLPTGESDYYQLGENRLRLHADESGTLVSLMLLD